MIALIIKLPRYTQLNLLQYHQSYIDHRMKAFLLKTLVLPKQVVPQSATVMMRLAKMLTHEPLPNFRTQLYSNSADKVPP